MHRIFPEGIPESYKEIARQWFKYRYGKDLEDFEILEYMENELITQLGSCLDPLLPDKNNLVYDYTRYLMLSDFYSKVKEEIEQ